VVGSANDLNPLSVSALRNIGTTLRCEEGGYEDQATK
jgi:hypothetical protein